MEDPSKSPTRTPTSTSTSTSAYYGILGLPKTASLPDIKKAYKGLVKQWTPDKNTSNKTEAEAKIKSFDEAYTALRKDKKAERKKIKAEAKKKEAKKKEEANGVRVELPKTPKYSFSDDEEFEISSPTLVSSTSTRVTPVTTPKGNLSRTTSRNFSRTSTSKNLSRCSSRRSITPTPLSTDFFASCTRNSSGPTTPTTPTTPTPEETVALAKMASKRHSTPIIFSQSTASLRRKPPPIEKKLECSLEELCHGGVKKIKITRDVISHFGAIVQEEEILTIKVKPGWKKGTKITFEGKGDERPGFLPADITFVIDEKRHHLFKREGDHLDLGVEVPLVQALTGCTITIPLLGGETMTLSFDDDILYPGYEKIIPDQGMLSKKDGRRGDLRLKFLVEFPTDLTDEERSEIVSILEQEEKCS